MEDTHLHHPPRSNVFESFSTTCKCIIGSGIISMPYAMYESGVWVGFFGVLLAAFLSYSTMSLIIGAVHLTRQRLRRRKDARMLHDRHEAERLGTPLPSSSSYGSIQNLNQTLQYSPQGKLLDPLDLSIIEQDPDLDVINYQQVAYVAYGETGRITTDSVLIFCQIGSCSAFLVLVLTNIQACLASYGHDVRLEVIALPLLPIVILLTLPRSTTYLAPAAHFGNFTLLVGVGTIIYYGLTSDTSAMSQDGIRGSWNVLTGLPAWSHSMYGLLVFFGVVSFAFAAHCEIVAVEADAKSRETYEFVLPSAIAFIALLYVFVGVFAYACFGERTEANILLNLGTSFFVNLVRIAFSCTLLVNFALALFPASQTLDLLVAGPAPASLDVPHQHEYSPSSGRRRMTRKSASSPALALNNDSNEDEGSHLLHGHSKHGSKSNTLEVPKSRAGAHLSVQTDFEPQSSGSEADSVPATPATPFVPEEVRLEREAAYKQYHQKGNVIRILSVIVTFAVGLLIQDLGVLFSLIGSVAGGLLCFTMPPLYWWRLNKLEQQEMSWLTTISLFVQTLLGLGLVASGIAVVIIAF